MRLLDLAFGTSAGAASAPVVIVNGHPDPSPQRFCAALALAYRDGIRASGGAAEVFAIGALKNDRAWSDMAGHLRDGADFAAVFPLWLDKPPPALTRFIAEAAPQCCRDIVVTMAMPAFLHRPMTFDSAQRATFIGSVETLSLSRRQAWLSEIRQMAGDRAARREVENLFHSYRGEKIFKKLWCRI